MKRTTLGLLAALALTPALAAEEDNFLLRNADDLVVLCDAKTEPRAVQMCHGFLVGVDRMHTAIRENLKISLYCLPTDGSVDRNTAAAAFVAWAKEQPNMKSMDALDGIIGWARTAYPCPDAK